MQAVETKIRENRRFTLITLSLEFPHVSRLVVYKIVTDDLNFKKLCSWWVPRLLTAEHKENRFASSLDFLIRYEEERDDMTSRIVTGDETWVAHITPESKQQVMEWRHTSYPVKLKAKQTLSKRKIMATVFWDRRGVFVVGLMPQGTTFNSGVYYATQRKLRRALQSKRRGMLSNLKHSLGGKRFSDNEEVKSAVNSWLSDQAADFFEEGFQNLVLSDEAHFGLNGYVNKQNCRIWSEANPQVYAETPLYPEKLTVWCALWAGGILQKR
ncbi:histone-lysine N-methyltransferase SETMAR [Trichonephila clavipes]|nr:histone-lysine N-methyltransferase SETMAR [Trichonephila clavipes]